MGFPPTVKLTVPEGPIGVNETPLSVAVNVTAALRLDAAEGEMVSVGLSWLTVCVTEGEVSPTPVSYVASPL
jgi:hypothetical protein